MRTSGPGGVRDHEERHPARVPHQYPFRVAHALPVMRQAREHQRTALEAKASLRRLVWSSGAGSDFGPDRDVHGRLCRLALHMRRSPQAVPHVRALGGFNRVFGPQGLRAALECRGQLRVVVEQFRLMNASPVRRSVCICGGKMSRGQEKKPRRQQK